VEQTVEIKSKITLKPSRFGKKYFVKTFGCQMNEHDSERVSGMFELDGMQKLNLKIMLIYYLLIHAQLGKMQMINFTEL
jgi:hypothetical protein